MPASTSCTKTCFVCGGVDPVFGRQRIGAVDGAVLGPDAFVLRYFGDNGDDRLLVVNYGRDLHLNPAPEPLLAPPEDSLWSILWSSRRSPPWRPWHLPARHRRRLAHTR